MILTYREAIREGMSIRMREDPRVILFGEDTGAYGAASASPSACMMNSAATACAIHRYPKAQ